MNTKLKPNDTLAENTEQISDQVSDHDTSEPSAAAQPPHRSLWKTWAADLLLFCFTCVYVELCLHLCVYHKVDRQIIYPILFALIGGIIFSLLTCVRSSARSLSCSWCSLQRYSWSTSASSAISCPSVRSAWVRT